MKRSYLFDLGQLDQAARERTRQLFSLLAETTGKLSITDAIMVIAEEDLQATVRAVAEGTPAAWFVLPTREDPGVEKIREEPEKKPAKQRKPKVEAPRCKNCGDTIKSARAGVQYCGKPECQKVHNAEYYRRKSGGTAQGTPEGSPLAEGNDQAGGAWPRLRETWVINDGPRAGQRLTSQELGVALQMRTIDPGIHVTHLERGRHLVFEAPGKKGLKMRQVGDNGPKAITLEN